MFFTTDNKIIIDNTRTTPTIECMQRKAAKTIPTELDMVQANKLAFGDEIGTTTNRITSMIEKQSIFKPESDEYKMLDYRIKCGQHYQQNSIDKAKGIIAKPMPEYWYSKSACKKLPESTEKEKRFKELCFNIVAENKPYFMKYVYGDLKASWNKYIKDTNSKCIREFKMTIEELLKKENKTIKEKEFLQYYENLKPAGDNPCIINRISWIFEKQFSDFLSNNPSDSDYDFSILKSGVEYSKKDYSEIKKIKMEYDDAVQNYKKAVKNTNIDKEEAQTSKQTMVFYFKSKCEQVCSNEKELCDILIDLCYSSNKSKQFVWDICGETIVNNLLEKNDYTIYYPVLVDFDEDFEFSGEKFRMDTKVLKEDEELSLS